MSIPFAGQHSSILVRCAITPFIEVEPIMMPSMCNFQKNNKKKIPLLHLLIKKMNNLLFLLQEEKGRER